MISGLYWVVMMSYKQFRARLNYFSCQLSIPASCRGETTHRTEIFTDQDCFYPKQWPRWPSTTWAIDGTGCSACSQMQGWKYCVWMFCFFQEPVQPTHRPKGRNHSVLQEVCHCFCLEMMWRGLHFPVRE